MNQKTSVELIRHSGEDDRLPSDVERASSVNLLVGRLVMLLGVLGVLAALFESSGVLPGRLESLIRSNSPLWLLTSGLMLVVGIGVIWNQSHRRTRWKPAMTGQRFHSLVVYSRQDCPLCEEALEVLSAYRAWLPAPVEVDVDQSEELRERFGDQVPVVEADGRIRFQGCVSPLLLRRLIEGTPPLARFKER